ncbi:MAG: type II secretion system protein GspJ [Gammaproteobacteria bacterium]|nr:type II secretion system protein GspJ [Gammaproteobacteria bacterium]OUV67867.1 MAG: type II secretion system protein GspJ [Gammaproteobacteria bacterium TMED133]
MRSYERGFTLIEVLVAISIFAIISLASTQLLRSVITTQSIVNISNESINDVSRALNVISRDISQVVARNIRDEYGDLSNALVIGSGEYILELSRTGWNNPALHTRSELQRVAYGLTDGALYRYFWLVLDRAEDSEPRLQKLLKGVESFSVRAITLEGEYIDIWPISNPRQVLPVGLEITFLVESLGEIRRTFALPELSAPMDGILSFNRTEERQEIEGTGQNYVSPRE